MGKLSAASRKMPSAGQAKPQAPSTYPEDVMGSGAGYLGTAPMVAKKVPMVKGPITKVHAPGKRGRF